MHRMHDSRNMRSACIVADDLIAEGVNHKRWEREGRREQEGDGDRDEQKHSMEPRRPSSSPSFASKETRLLDARCIAIRCNKCTLCVNMHVVAQRQPCVSLSLFLLLSRHGGRSPCHLNSSVVICARVAIRRMHLNQEIVCILGARRQ